MPKEPAWLGNEGQKGPSEDSKTSQDNWCQEMISKLALWLTKKINTRNSQWKWPITLINSQSVWVAFPVLIEVWWLSALVAKNQLWKKKKQREGTERPGPGPRAPPICTQPPGQPFGTPDVYDLLPGLPSKWQFLESHWRALQAVCYLCGVLWIWFLPEMTSWQTCFPKWQYFTRKWFEIKGQEVDKFSNVLHRPETPTEAWAHGQGGRAISMNQRRSLV